ncbi:hypothetical protein [Streptococcus dentiloxodontae]
MTSTIIIQLQNLYASLSSRSLGCHPLKTSLAVVDAEGYILSATPVFQNVFGKCGAHIKTLPFDSHTKAIKSSGGSEQETKRLNKWITETMLVPVDRDLYLTKIQKIHRHLSLLPDLKSIQTLTNDRFLLNVNKELTDADLRILQGQILNLSGSYSLIGASSAGYNKALIALDSAKQNPNGRARYNQPETAFKRSLDVIHHFFQTKSAA